jgi:glycine dehydrogenase
MLKALNLKSLDDLMKSVVPEKVYDHQPYVIENGFIPEPIAEELLFEKFQAVADKNKLYKCYIGGGYYGTITPAVIQRNLIEDPNWYTAYTPYQGEISQGRLESILNYQTLVTELTGLEIANASLLDEGTACAESMTMCYSLNDQTKHTFFVASNVFPQSIEVVKTRADNIGIKVVVGDPDSFDFSKIKDDLFGILLQSPDVHGVVHNYKGLIDKLKADTNGSCRVAIASDPLALLKIVTPGEMGVDVAIGNMQRFGVPMGYGGPHAAFMATLNSNLRKMPGRIIGISKDRFGNKAYRMTLQTREQHIRREKATSNICTAQVLLANVSAMYAIYHGKAVKSIILFLNYRAFLILPQE